jgi:hypothetical protein
MVADLDQAAEPVARLVGADLVAVVAVVRGHDVEPHGQLPAAGQGQCPAAGRSRDEFPLARRSPGTRLSSLCCQLTQERLAYGDVHPRGQRARGRWLRLAWPALPYPTAAGSAGGAAGLAARALVAAAVAMSAVAAVVVARWFRRGGAGERDRILGGHAVEQVQVGQGLQAAAALPAERAGLLVLLRPVNDAGMPARACAAGRSRPDRPTAPDSDKCPAADLSTRSPLVVPGA